MLEDEQKACYQDKYEVPVMYKFVKLAVLLSLFSVFVFACDDDSNNSNNSNNNPGLPSASLSTVEKGNVIYSVDETILQAPVTVTVVDSDGNPLEGHAVRPVFSGELSQTVTSTEDVLITDANGTATFNINSNALGLVAVSIEVSETDTFTQETPISIEATAEIDFDFSVNVIPLDSTFEFNQGIYNMRFTVSDEAGPVSDASVSLEDETSGALLSPAEGTTDSQGRIISELTTPVAGVHAFSLSLEGIETAKTVQIELSGPSIAGMISNSQHYPLGFYSARVGLFSINAPVGIVDLTDPLLSEVVSESTCPCPGPAEYELILPIQGPDLIENDSMTILQGFYAVVVYDDLNDNHQWDEGEYLLGVNQSTGILMFQAPVTGTLENAGWNIVNSFMDTFEILDWDLFHDNINIGVTRSPVFSPEVEVEMETAAFTEGRIAFAVVNGNQSIIDDDSYMERTDITTLLATGTIIHDQLLTADSSPVTLTDVDDILTAQEIENMEFTYIDPSGNLVSAVRVTAFMYDDLDASGSWTEGDSVKAVLGFDDGRDGFILWVTDYDNYHMFESSSQISWHAGYLPLLKQARGTVSSVSSSGSDWEISMIPAPCRNYNGTFSVVRGMGVIASGDLTTGNTPGFTATAANCTNCGNIQVGDTIIFEGTLEAEDRAIADFHRILMRYLN